MRVRACVGVCMCVTRPVFAQQIIVAFVCLCNYMYIVEQVYKIKLITYDGDARGVGCVGV